MKTLLKYAIICFIAMALFSFGLSIAPVYLGLKYEGYSYEVNLFMSYSEYMGYLIILCTVWLSYLLLKK